MSFWTGFVFVLVVVLDLLVLASSRLRGAIRTVAFQGAVLSVLPLLLATEQHQAAHVVVLALGALVVKSVVIPGMMLWAMREAAIRRELEPIVGFVPSMVLGAVGVAVAFSFSASLPLPMPERHALLVPTAMATVWTGLILVVTRRKAVTQVLGLPGAGERDLRVRHAARAASCRSWWRPGCCSTCWSASSSWAS